MFITLRLILLVTAASFALSQAAAAQPSQSNRCCVAPSDAVIAIIDGESVRVRDIEAYSRTADPRQLFLLNHQLQDPRRSLLDNLNDEHLLEREAARLSKTVSQLLDERLHGTPVTDAEILRAFKQIAEQHPAITYAGMAPVLRMFLEGQRKSVAKARYVKELKKATDH